MATKSKSKSSKSTSSKDVNAIDLLKSQHREVEDLFKKIEAAKDGSQKEELFIQIADKLAMHAKIEELHFYPQSRDEETEDELREALEEHLGVKRVIADMLDMEPEDEQFDAKCTMLKELVEHHVKEEETSIFPKVKKLLDEEELVAIAQEMIATQDELEGTDPRLQVPKEIEEAARL